MSNVISTVVLIEDTVSRQTNVANRHKSLRIPTGSLFYAYYASEIKRANAARYNKSRDRLVIKLSCLVIRSICSLSVFRSLIFSFKHDFFTLIIVFAWESASKREFAVKFSKRYITIPVTPGPFAFV